MLLAMQVTTYVYRIEIRVRGRGMRPINRRKIKSPQRTVEELLDSRAPDCRRLGVEGREKISLL